MLYLPRGHVPTDCTLQKEKQKDNNYPNWFQKNTGESVCLTVPNSLGQQNCNLAYGYLLGCHCRDPLRRSVCRQGVSGDRCGQCPCRKQRNSIYICHYCTVQKNSFFNRYCGLYHSGSLGGSCAALYLHARSYTHRTESMSVEAVVAFEVILIRLSCTAQWHQPH